MAKQQSAAPRAQELYTRFTVAQRIEHIVLLTSFATLGLTGLSQKFVGNAVAEGIRTSFGLRVETRSVPAGTLPRFELKARRVVREAAG